MDLYHGLSEREDTKYIKIQSASVAVRCKQCFRSTEVIGTTCIRSERTFASRIKTCMIHVYIYIYTYHTVYTLFYILIIRGSLNCEIEMAWCLQYHFIFLFFATSPWSLQPWYCLPLQLPTRKASGGNPTRPFRKHHFRSRLSREEPLVLLGMGISNEVLPPVSQPPGLLDVKWRCAHMVQSMIGWNGVCTYNPLSGPMDSRVCTLHVVEAAGLARAFIPSMWLSWVVTLSWCRWCWMKVLILKKKAQEVELHWTLQRKPMCVAHMSKSSNFLRPVKQWPKDLQCRSFCAAFLV